jgi:transcriptional regulator with XRE-family HTH domain
VAQRPRRARQRVVEGANPTVRQRELGRRLRDLRIAKGLTVEEVGLELLCSATKISRIETASRRVSLRDVRDLCRVYEVTDSTEIDMLMALAGQARDLAWWSQYHDLRLDPYIGLEQEAIGITSYTSSYIPPLLQTAEYARAIIRAIGRKLDESVIEQRVEARMRRQELLRQTDPPNYMALLDEAVLHRPAGSWAIMRAQISKILAWTAADKGSIQVIPFTAGVHASADSNFDLLEFRDDSRQNSVVYVEGLIGALYHERPSEVARYRDTIEYLQESALSTKDSLGLIARIRDNYGSSKIL